MRLGNRLARVFHGLGGFLVMLGDALTGEPDPDPMYPIGPSDYLADMTAREDEQT